VRRVVFTLFLILAAGLDSSTALGANSGLSQTIGVVSLPLPPKASVARHGNGELFFDIEDTAPPTADRAMRPRRVRVYWDHSIARVGDDLEAEKTLLFNYLDRVHPGIVDLVLLSAGAPELRIIEAPQEAEQLADLLRELRYETTATAHEIADLDLPPADACLYFSDGTGSVDPTDAERIRCPLFAISSAENANRGLMRVLARRGAGAYFDLTEMGPDDAVVQLTGSQPRILSVASSDGGEIDYALLPSGTDRFRVIGPIPKSGDIIVTLASGAARVRTYSIKRAPVRQSDAIGALWAVDQLHELSASTRLEPDRIIALARRYSLEAAIPTN
jgi:hypothetical protein